MASLDKDALPPLPPLVVDDQGNQLDAKARVARRDAHLEWHRKRNGLPPAPPPLKRPKPN